MEHRHRALPGRMTSEEFPAWCSEDAWAEWIDGAVSLLSSASERHHALVWSFGIVLGIFAEVRGRGIVLSAPFQMNLGSGGPGREPDLLFVARGHLDRLRTPYLKGPADLVVEITAPERISRGCGEKYGEYEAAGIPSIG